MNLNRNLMKDIKDPIVRKLMEEIERQAMTQNDVENFITGQTWGFQEVSTEEGDRGIQLNSRSVRENLETLNYTGGDTVRPRRRGPGGTVSPPKEK